MPQSRQNDRTIKDLQAELGEIVQLLMRLQPKPGEDGRLREDIDVAVREAQRMIRELPEIANSPGKAEKVLEWIVNTLIRLFERLVG